MKCENCRKDMTPDEVMNFATRCGECEAEHFVDALNATADEIKIDARQIAEGTNTLQ